MSGAAAPVMGAGDAVLMSVTEAGGSMDAARQGMADATIEATAEELNENT